MEGKKEIKRDHEQDEYDRLNQASRRTGQFLSDSALGTSDATTAYGRGVQRGATSAIRRLTPDDASHASEPDEPPDEEVTEIPVAMLNPRRCDLPDGRNTRIPVDTRNTVMMPIFPGMHDDPQRAPREVPIVLPRPNASVSANAWSRLDTHVPRYERMELTHQGLAPTEDELQAFALLGITPTAAIDTPGVGSPNAWASLREGPDWALPVPTTLEDLRAIRRCLDHRYGETVAIGLCTHLDRLETVGFRFLPPQVALVTDPDLWQDLRGFLFEGWLLAPPRFNPPGPTPPVSVVVASTPPRRALRPTLEGRAALAQLVHPFQAEWILWSTQTHYAAITTQSLRDAWCTSDKYFLRIFQHLHPGVQVTVQSALGEDDGSPGQNNDHRPAPRPPAPSGGPPAPSTTPGSAAPTGGFGDHGPHAGPPTEALRHTDGSRDQLLILRDLLADMEANAERHGYQKPEDERALQELSAALRMEHVHARSQTQTQPQMGVSGLSDLFGSQASPSARASASVPSPHRSPASPEMSPPFTPGFVAPRTIGANPLANTAKAETRAPPPPATQIIPRAEPRKVAPVHVPDDLSAVSSLSGGPLRRVRPRADEPIDEAPLNPRVVADTLNRRGGTRTSLGQALGAISAATRHVAYTPQREVVVTYRPSDGPPEELQSLQQQLELALLPDSAQSAPDLRWFPQQGTTLDRYDPLLDYDLDTVSGVGTVARLRSGRELRPGAFIAPLRGVLRTEAPAFGTYAVRHDFPLSRRPGHRRSPGDVEMGTVYIDDCLRTGLPSYACDPRGMWYEVTDCVTDEDFAAAVNRRVCHHDARLEGRRYVPCVANCAYHWVESNGVRVPGLIVLDKAIFSSNDSRLPGPVLMAHYTAVTMSSLDSQSYFSAQLEHLDLLKSQRDDIRQRGYIPLRIGEMLAEYVAARMAEYQALYFQLPVQPRIDIDGQASYLAAVASSAHRAFVQHHGIPLQTRWEWGLRLTDDIFMRPAITLAHAVDQRRIKARDMVTRSVPIEPHRNSMQRLDTTLNVEDLLHEYEDREMDSDADSTSETSSADTDLNSEASSFASVAPPVFEARPQDLLQSAARQSTAALLTTGSQSSHISRNSSQRDSRPAATATPALRRPPPVSTPAISPRPTDGPQFGSARRALSLRAAADANVPSSALVLGGSDVPTADTSNLRGPMFGGPQKSLTVSTQDAMTETMREWRNYWVDSLKSHYSITYSRTLDSVLPLIQDCYVWRRDRSSQYNNQEFKVKAKWCKTHKLDILEYINKLNVTAGLANRRYSILTSELVDGDPFLEKAELSLWGTLRQRCKMDIQHMLRWTEEGSEEESRAQAMITFLFRCYVSLYYVHKPQHEVVSTLLNTRLRDNHGRHLREMHGKVLELYARLTDQQRLDIYEFCDLTTLLLFLIGQGPLTGTAAERVTAQGIATFVRQTLDRLQQAEHMSHVTGAALDGLLARAVDECQAVYLRDFDATNGGKQNNTKDEPAKRDNGKRNRDARDGKRDRDKTKIPANTELVVRATTLADRDVAVIKQQLDSLPKASAKGMSKISARPAKANKAPAPAPPSDDDDDDPYSEQQSVASMSDSESSRGLRVNAVYKPIKLSEAELAEHLVTQSQYDARFEGCWTCGSNEHSSNQCDVAFLATESGSMGTMNFTRLAEVCIGKLKDRTSIVAAFNKRMAMLKCLRNFKGTDEVKATKAHRRWSHTLSQATGVLRALMADRKIT